MLEFIRTWGTSLITAAVLGSIFQAILPKHELSKAVRVLVGLYLALVILSPLLNAKDIQLPQELELYESQAAAAEYDEAVVEQTQTILCEKIEQELQQQGVIYYSIETVVLQNAQGCIYCEQVRLILDSGAREQESQVVAAIAVMCGVSPIIEYWEAT